MNTGKLYIILVTVVLAFSSCRHEPLQTSIALDDDFSALVDAIRNADKTLSEKLSQLEEALSGGLVDQTEALKQIQSLVASMEGSMKEKLNAVALAVRSQTTSLETKLALVEAAFSNGFVDAGQQQDLLLLALNSLNGTVAEKLAALETAVKTQMATLEAKAALVEAAVKGGFADSAAALALILAAIDASGDTVEEKAAAVVAAVSGQTADLGAKLALIETALKQGFADESDRMALLKAALEAIQGDAEERFSAIEAAMGSQTSGLESKFALIVSAVEQGFMNAKTAIETMQTALLASLQTTNDSLAELKVKVLAKLSTVSGQLTQEELAKAYKDIEEAIAAQAASSEACLNAILNAVKDLIHISFTYLGDPADVIAVNRGGELTVPFIVNPPTFPVAKDSLELQIISDDRFFLPMLGPGDGGDHFFVKSVQADQTVPGKYLVTISCDSPVVMWEESRLAMVYHMSGKSASSESFPVHMVPRITEGLNIWHYPRASFEMNEINGIKLGKDSLGAIYAALDKSEFVNKDNPSNVRIFNASLIESAEYFPESYTLHNVTHANGDNNAYATVRTIYQKGQDYMRFLPDTAKSLVWKDYCCSIGCMHLDITGKLVLADSWQRKDTINDFKLSWWNTTWYPDHKLKCSLNEIDDTGVVKDTVKLESLFGFCGVKNSEINVPYDRFSVDRSRFVYPQSHAMTGTFVDKNWKFPYEYVNDEWNMLLNVGTGTYNNGDQLSMQGYVTVSVFPSESAPAFKVQQQLVHYELMLTIQ